MSRADWGFLEHLLVEGQEYSTNVGRVWLTVLFLFRLLVLGTAAESAWDDEQSDFVCNTKQPGCEAVCYDKAFPVSHFRYFVLQVIFVSTPTIFYFGYVALKTREDQKPAEEIVEEQRGRQRNGKANQSKLDVIKEEDEEDEKQLEKRKKEGEPPKLKGKLLGAYAASIVLKVVLEVGFIVGLWFLYGFVVAAKYECKRDPCPHTVDCFVSRPTEKTIFTIYTQVIAAISAFLNILELFHLLKLAITHSLEKRYQYQELGRQIERTPTKLELAEVHALSYEEKGHLFLPVDNNSYTQSSLDWTEREHHLAEDMLPSYSNCVRSSNHRHHSKKHIHSKKHSKSDHKEKRSKDKHYV
ncbi:gap junction protein alpha 4 [Colossoma macropomum]|uniref:gap junction protein alpha 4 n=1 Tax=Colossoma macropomum TaxID=42526 RepID=UPI0018647114|nr:gap junction protein alpha 4 [Colossoma macropomum]